MNWELTITILLLVLIGMFVFKYGRDMLLSGKKVFIDPSAHGLSTHLKGILIDKTQYAIIATDEFGVILMWNGSATKLFGWTPDELLGKNISDYIIPQEFRLMHIAGMKKWRDTGEGHIVNNDKGVEIIGQDRYGKKFPIHLKLMYINDGGFKVLASFIKNISEEVAERDKLKEDLKFCMGTLEMGDIGGWEWDLSKDYMVMDLQCRRIFNIPENLPLTVSDLMTYVYPKDQMRAAEAARIAAEEKRDVKNYFRRVQKNGQMCWIESKSHVVLDDYGNVAKLIGTMRSVGTAKESDTDYHGNN